MDWVDLVILAVLAGAIFVGMVQGFFRTTCSLLGLVLGVVLASWNYLRLAAVLKRMVPLDSVADAIAYLAIAVAVMIAANVAGVVLKKFFRWMGMGCIDTLGGAIAGFVQGALLVTVCILVTVAFFPQTEWLTRAKFPQLFFGTCHLSTHMSPDELSERVRGGLKTLKHELPQWTHEKSGGS
jgi:membrane protein required for colicin V production